MNIFEKASRTQLRFQTSRGLMDVESLWVMPLTAKSDKEAFSLDDLAKDLHRTLKGREETSFVVQTVDAGKELLELKLELVKHVIAVKLEEAAERQRLQSNAGQRERLTSILAQKEDAALAELTPEQLKAKIAELGG
jgi:hypothetical protein